jgi:hypothetical protein
VDPTEGPLGGAQCCSCPFAGVAMDLAPAITIIIPRSCAPTVGHGGMARLTATIALPFVGREPRATRGHVVGHEGVAGLPVRVVAHPKTLLARLPRDHADAGGPIVGRGAVSCALMGPPAGWIDGVAMRHALFPRRAGTARRPHSWCLSSCRWGP